MFVSSFWRRRIIAFLFALLILSVSGPFGTYEAFDLAERVAYWAVGLLGCGICFETVAALGMRWNRLAHWPDFAKIAVSAAVASVPAAFFFAGLDHVARGSGIPLSSMGWMWFSVFAIGIAMTFANYLPALVRQDAKLDEREISARRFPFLQRLPESLGKRLMSMSMQDHYVHVTTERGSELIRVSFSTALNELKNYPGLRVHRSHWVALDAISGFSRSGRGHVVELSDGRNLPVSRTYLPDARRQYESLHGDENRA